MNWELVEATCDGETRGRLGVGKNSATVGRGVVAILGGLICALSICALPLLAAEASTATEPLSKEDVMLLVLSGASTERKGDVIRERGIDFRMTADTARELRDLGAEEKLLNVLAGSNPSAEQSKTAGGALWTSPFSTDDLQQRGADASSGGVPPGLDREPEGYTTPDNAKLARPSDGLIGKIIQEFVRKDQIFRKALTNYNYHQLVTVKQLNKSGKVVGVYRRGWDNVFDDAGNQISRVTYSAPGSLKRISISEDDSRCFEQTLFTTEVRPDYDFEYLDHVHLDRLTAYTFSVRPKQIEPGKRYFEGTIWVDDQDLQVVKVDGRRVPAIRTVENDVIKETLFPRFIEYRQQVDGKYWFPTVDFSDDTLQFAFGTVHVQVLVNYSQYRSFGAESHLVTPEPGTPLAQDVKAVEEPLRGEIETSAVHPKL